ncbi:sugar phosphate isomerase/epimerase family protein [Streptomyces acidiscabies]|uniref:Sugar phosphate isomerase/epimerase n=1 Tax=Streptomyces acidiscabies TaxID=42234 RepID=A0AAP6BIC8_9ACTN|nr:sugar phosphate isomerase/epimerase [Streptomyces acidiscabies]MBP5942286.1 TIM barrel protein [Streptomyces sp. LBUM 1476]MBZ3913820.1 TIM barrel protein [Streptomyces acidiscabies]MDX2965295.1 sugar phosphate isomerase/epimerase [Streptomyces acidiscabies]MDX3022089.1 sugar phosphate isomerase/epimerase [Streptomyces acidiscabies]MDX3793653.1 sugar phosphate isomerase/epimerase [Streptomyces acidiscabies]
MTPLFATDVVTFYHPDFWGLDSAEALRDWAHDHPRAFWERVMDALAEAGITGLELTFPPGDIDSALRAYGSAASFRRALADRGLSVVSAFIAGSDAPDWRQDGSLPAIVADAERRAAFLSEVGAGLLVAGLPMRTTLGTRPPFFVDAAYMTRMADIAHVVGEAVSRYGVKLAFHTESNSTLWYERDIDLFMALTDPRYVWLCPDSCHIALGGGDPVAVARRHSQRIALAHWKDAVKPIDVELTIDETVFAQQQPYMAELGTGIVEWRAWAEVMSRTPGAGVVLVELDEAVDPVAALRAGRAVVEGVLAGAVAGDRTAPAGGQSRSHP